MTSASHIEWRISEGLVPYPEALAFMEARAADIADGTAPETIWLLEHPPLYTAGTSTQPGDLLEPDRFPVFQTGRGGQYTYHGPGQRVGYVMLNVKARGGDVRKFVQGLEEWLIRSLARLGVAGERRAGRIGIWVRDEATGGENKIAALGLRIRRGVSFHGVSLNVAPDLSHFAGIVPCGIRAHGVTSLKQLGLPHDMRRVDTALRATLGEVFPGAAPAMVNRS
ncbi:MAG: lipoyl(octanoyl) transferase LipB [Alphaproteobacteria bacterium]|nr:lipoyl(octanoyl) transferase LipB [Alphaproteobacteria bacterium]